jgi:LysR family transcriptional regulator, regulator for bpeEF and oprC
LDRIDLFRTFIRVVECASFTRAADTLGLPRSSVSAAVIDLEARVGARLLHRSTRKVSPTQDGAVFYERCLRLIADVEETAGLFRQTSIGPSGRLRIDVPGRIGRLIIAPALPHFLALYPQLDIELRVTNRAVNLVEESVDCSLRVGPLSDSGLISRKIRDLPLINSRARATSRITVSLNSPPISACISPSTTPRLRPDASRIGNGSRMARFELCPYAAASL